MFVLLHGAFRGGWSWTRVRPLLSAAGHDVHTPTIRAGRLAEHVGAVRDYVSSRDLTDVVLCGHSQGGFIARAAAEVCAPRLRALAYLDAPVPRDGESPNDLARLAGLDVPATLPVVVEPWPQQPGPGMSPADAAWITARLVPEPTVIAGDAVSLTDAAAAALPGHYAFCTLTPPSYPCTVTRRRLDAAGAPYTLLDAAHDAPVTAPTTVATWLLNLAGA